MSPKPQFVFGLCSALSLALVATPAISKKPSLQVLAVLPINSDPGVDQLTVKQLGIYLRARITEQELYEVVSNTVVQKGLETVTKEFKTEKKKKKKTCYDNEECIFNLGGEVDANKLFVTKIVTRGASTEENCRITATVLNVKRRTSEHAASKVTACDIEGLERGIDKIIKALRSKMKKRKTASRTNTRSGEKIEVRFESVPSGAQVENKDQLICVTPCKVKLSQDTHTIAMKKVRYLTTRKKITVTPDIPTVSFNLRPDFGWLSVKTQPANASIYIDEERISKAPLIEHELPPGRHEVVVRAKRHHEKGRHLVIKRGKNKRVQFKLSPITGTLIVIAHDEAQKPLPAKVTINGKVVGKAPFKRKQIIGDHKVKISYDGLSTSKTVRIKEDEIEKYSANLDFEKRRQEALAREREEEAEEERQREDERDREREEDAQDEYESERYAEKVTEASEERGAVELYTGYIYSHHPSAGDAHGFMFSFHLQPMDFFERRINIGARFDNRFYTDTDQQTLEIDGLLGYHHYFVNWALFVNGYAGTALSTFLDEWDYNIGIEGGVKAYLAPEVMLHLAGGTSRFSDYYLTLGLGIEGGVAWSGSMVLGKYALYGLGLGLLILLAAAAG